jgi:hypothetical protein
VRSLVVILAAAVLSVPAAGARGSVELSSNWAGYVVSGTTGSSVAGSFTAVSATWKVPKVTCTGAPGQSGVAVWVGLGGYRRSSGTLEQIGTDSDCRAGQARYYAWWEVLPDPSNTMRLAVGPGDTIAASVELTATGLQLRLANVTTGVTAVKRPEVSLVPAGSAEWVLEAPSLCNLRACRVVPLARFGTARFRQATVTGNGVAAPAGARTWRRVAIRLVPGSGKAFFPDGPEPDVGTIGTTAGAEPGAFSPDGTSFTITWRPR